jgi:hypothetical protein
METLIIAGVILLGATFMRVLEDRAQTEHKLR